MARKQKPFEIPSVTIDDYYEITVGEFGVVSEGKSDTQIDWYNCREDFQNDYPSLGRMLYYGAKKTNDATKAFVRRIEQLLKLPRKKRIKWRATTKKHILYLSLGDFWKTMIHRSLLTILLRAGRQYNKKTDNWQHVIQTDTYLRHTPVAIERFLKGYTHPVLLHNEIFLGWVDEYAELTPELAKRKFTK